MDDKTLAEQKLDLENKNLRLKWYAIIISLLAIPVSILSFTLPNMISTKQIKETARIEKEKAELQAMLTVSKMLVQPEGSDENRKYRAEITNIQFIYLLEETFSKKDVAILADFDPYHPYELIDKISSAETKTALCTVIDNNLTKKADEISDDEIRLKNNCEKHLAPAK